MAKDKGECATGPAIGGGILGAVGGGVAGAIIGAGIGGPVGGVLGALAGAVLGAAGGSLLGSIVGLIGCWLQETFGGGSGATWKYARPSFKRLELMTHKTTLQEEELGFFYVLTSVEGNDDRANLVITYTFTAEEGDPPEDKVSFAHNATSFSRPSPAFTTKWAKQHDRRIVKCTNVTIEAEKNGKTMSVSEDTISPELEITIVPK